MLNRLRKGVKSLTAKVLIVLLVISFAVWGIGDIFSFRLDARVAKVGEAEVSAERFADALSRQQSRLSRQSGEIVTFERMREAGIGGAVLSGLIRDAAFEAELNELGLSAPDAAVAEAVREHQAFQGPDGAFSRQMYELSLQQQGMAPSEFEELTRTVLAQEILMEAAQAGAVAPPGAAQRIAAYRGEERSANVMRLPLDAAPEPGTPSDQELQAFYDEHQEMFRVPERRWGEYLHVDAESLLDELTPPEEELRAAYEAEKDRYTTPETRALDQVTFPDRAAAEEAIGRLLSGEVTFEAMAGEQGLAPADIDLGEVTRGDLPAAAAAAVFDQQEPGIVGPVELPAGHAVYRVREVDSGGAQPFAEVRDEIAERLARDKLLTRAPEVANEIEELRAAGRSFEEIARETAAVHGEFDGLARDGTLADGGEAEGLAARQSFINEAFEALDAEERDLVETEQGGYFLVMVRRFEESRVPPLEEVREKAVQAWQKAQRLEALEKRAEEIVGRLGEEVSIWDVGEELDVAVVPQGPFTRMNPPQALPSELVDRIFRTKSGQGAYAAAADGKAVVVAQVSSVTMPPSERIEAQSQQIETVLANSLERDLGEYYARAVVAGHDPRIEWGVVDEVFERLGAASQGTP